LTKSLRLFRRGQEFYLSSQFHIVSITQFHHIEKNGGNASSPLLKQGVSALNFR
jgi:hypothetical protein